MMMVSSQMLPEENGMKRILVIFPVFAASAIEYFTQMMD